MKHSKFKKCYLTDNLSELSNTYNELAEKYVDLQDKVSKNHLGFSEKANLINLPIEVDNHNRLIYDRDCINENLGKDLYYSKQELIKKNQQLQSFAALIHGLQCTIASYGSAISVRDNMIGELNTRINQYFDDIRALKARENDWEADFERLREEVTKKKESVDDLNKQLEAMSLEKDTISSEYDMLKAEKDSQDVLIEEQATRLNLLQEAKNGLTMRVAELEREVETLKGVITVRNEEKREAIRQLSSSLEHYKSRYEDLRKAYVINKVSAGCFDFLN